MTTPSTPTGAKLTDEEWRTIQHVVHDWGLVDSYFIADWSSVERLKEKFNTDRFDKEDING